jgi:glycosyltransferase involved in cell wall biosynthesis
MKLKILHLANVIGEHKGGGVHEVVVNLYKNQKALGHEPHIWYPGMLEDSDSIRLDNNVKALDTYGDSKYGIIKDLFKPIDSSLKSFDIIHQHGVWMPMSLFNLRIKKNINVPSLIQPHGYLEPFRLNQKKSKKKLGFLLYEKRNISKSNVILACSSDEGNKLKDMFPYKTVATIKNGIAHEFLSAPSLKNKSNDVKILLFLSQIIPLKGLDRLIEVIYELGRESFWGWELHIAGYNAGAYGDILASKVKKLNISDIVKFIGPQLGEDKTRNYDNATAFVLPTFNENFGIVVAEALSRGLPVLTTKGTPWADLELYNCGYWVDNDKEGIKKGILKLLSKSNNELELMGKRGKKLIKEKYLWNFAAQKSIELYKWMINGGTPPNFIKNF